jgi:hypothetical protein
MNTTKLSHSQNWTPESAVNQIVKIVKSSQDPADLSESIIYNKISELGIPHSTADLAYKFTQIAWGRVFLDDMGLEFSSEYFCFNGAGNVVEHGLLIENPFFKVAIKLAKKCPKSQFSPIFAVMSADVQVVNDALNAGASPKDLVLFPPCLFIEPPTSEGAQKAQKYISLKMSYRHLKKVSTESKPIKNKPWWKF